MYVLRTDHLRLYKLSQDLVHGEEILQGAIHCLFSCDILPIYVGMSTDVVIIQILFKDLSLWFPKFDCLSYAEALSQSRCPGILTVTNFLPLHHGAFWCIYRCRCLIVNVAVGERHLGYPVLRFFFCIWQVVNICNGTNCCQKKLVLMRGDSNTLWM